MAAMACTFHLVHAPCRQQLHLHPGLVALHIEQRTVLRVALALRQHRAGRDPERRAHNRWRCSSPASAPSSCAARSRRACSSPCSSAARGRDACGRCGSRPRSAPSCSQAGCAWCRCGSSTTLMNLPLKGHAGGLGQHLIRAAHHAFGVAVFETARRHSFPGGKNAWPKGLGATPSSR
jgi:hypothetical protein